MYLRLKLYSDGANWCCSKREPSIFFYKGMIVTQKLVTRSSDSTKMSFLPAIRPVIKGQIVMPHTRLHAEP